MNRNLKLLRAIKKMNQQEVAKYLGISKAAYVKKENDKTEFTVSEAIKLCELFEKTFEQLFVEEIKL